MSEFQETFGAAEGSGEEDGHVIGNLTTDERGSVLCHPPEFISLSGQISGPMPLELFVGDHSL